MWITLYADDTVLVAGSSEKLQDVEHTEWGRAKTMREDQFYKDEVHSNEKRVEKGINHGLACNSEKIAGEKLESFRFYQNKTHNL